MEPAEYIPKFLDAMNANGAEALVAELNNQLTQFAAG